MSLSLGQKAGWGLADMGIVVFVIVKQLLILAFMNSFLGIPIALAGAVTTAVLIFDIISDPIIGYFSDKTVSRFGRRAPVDARRSRCFGTCNDWTICCARKFHH